MDAVATAATDFVLSSEHLPALVNVVHPRPSSWRGVMESINSSLGRKLKLVPFADWLGAVEAIGSRGTSADVERVVGFGAPW